MHYKSQVAECMRNDFCCCGCGRVGRTYPWGFDFYPVADAHLPGNVLIAVWRNGAKPTIFFSLLLVLGYALARRHRTAVSSVEEDITVLTIDCVGVLARTRDTVLWDGLSDPGHSLENRHGDHSGIALWIIWYAQIFLQNHSV